MDRILREEWRCRRGEIKKYTTPPNDNMQHSDGPPSSIRGIEFFQWPWLHSNGPGWMQCQIATLTIGLYRRF